MRKTKIICTIGPASQSEEILEQMMLAGMDTARLNFSHGTHEEHQKTINTIKKIRQKLGIPMPIMLDTKGPEYRIGTFENNHVFLNTGDLFQLTTRDISGNNTIVSVNYKKLISELQIGDKILVNDGKIVLTVEELTEDTAVCRIIHGGKLSNNKSMNFPGKIMSHEYLSARDKADLLFGIENDIDFVAASFASTAEDAKSIRDFLDANGGSDICVIAKIENPSGVQNLEEICDYVDGIMVARGDLGVEIPFIEIPVIQKDMTKKCRIRGKRVVTATEMLESMVENIRPTRAEVSDVANAVFLGSSAIMLSGETASGKYPVEAVKTMADIAEYTEQNINYNQLFSSTEYHINNTLDAISHATCAMAIDVNAKAIVVNSISGQTARMVSRFRCPTDIIGTTDNEKVWRQLSLSWGVTPVLHQHYDNQEDMYIAGLIEAKKMFNLKEGDLVVLTGGIINGIPGNTNTIKVEKIN